MEFKIWFLTHTDSKCSAATRGQWLLKAQTHNISATVRRPGGQCCPRTYQGIRNKDPCLLGVPRPHTVPPPMAAKGFFLKQKSAVSHLCLNSPLPILVTRKKNHVPPVAGQASCPPNVQRHALGTPWQALTGELGRGGTEEQKGFAAMKLSRGSRGNKSVYLISKRKSDRRWKMP